jgi:hypothetical protein
MDREGRKERLGVYKGLKEESIGQFSHSCVAFDFVISMERGENAVLSDC